MGGRMTKIEAVKRFKISRWKLQRLISGEQIFKYNALKKRSWTTGEVKLPELQFGTHYQFKEKGVLVLTEAGINYLSINYGERK